MKKPLTKNHLGPVTFADKAAGDRLLAHGQEIAERQIESLKSTPRHLRTEWYHNSLLYWEAAYKFSKWLRARNRMRRVATVEEILEWLIKHASPSE